MKKSIKSQAPVGVYCSTWTTLCCPGCNTVNWVNDGDITQITSYYAEAVICYSCDTKFWRTATYKQEADMNAFIDDPEEDPLSPDDMGLGDDEDLIETAMVEKGECRVKLDT